MTSAGTTVAPAEALSRQYECLGMHFTKMASDWDVRFDSRRSVDEYTADLTGLDLALEAMRADVGLRGGAAEAYWQHVREVFVAYAQFRCSSSADYVSEMKTRIDRHPSVRVQVNGVVSELPEFARAFSCQPGQPMAPVQRCVAW